MTNLNDPPVTINASPEFSQDTLDRALQEMFPVGLVLVLTRDGIEIDDSGYQQQPVVFSHPQSMGQTRARLIFNTQEIRFGPWRVNAEVIDGCEARSLNSNDWVARWTIHEEAREGRELFIEPRQLIAGLR